MAKDKYIVRQFQEGGFGKMKWGVYIQVSNGEETGIHGKIGKITDAALVAAAEGIRLAVRIAVMLNDGR